jgi:hypothetical protein
MIGYNNSLWEETTMIRKLGGMLGIAFCLTACFIFAEQTTIKSRLNPAVSHSHYKSFYLHLATRTDNRKQAAPSLLSQEKRLLKQLKYGLISRGYYFTPDPEKADFWVVISYNNMYNPNHQSLKDDPVFQSDPHSFYKEITKIGGNNHSQPHVELLFYNPRTGEQLWYAFGYSDGISVNLADWGSRVISNMLRRYPFSEDYGGIGITIDRNLKILKVFEGSPAQQQGLKPDDTIIRIDGVKISHYEQGVNMLKGKSYTTVSVTVIRSLPNPDNTGNVEKELTSRIERWPVNKFYLPLQ